jgi:hypothetical protein
MLAERYQKINKSERGSASQTAAAHPWRGRLRAYRLAHEDSLGIRREDVAAEAGSADADQRYFRGHHRAGAWRLLAGKEMCS